MDTKFKLMDIMKNENRLETLLIYPSHCIENDPNEHTQTDYFLNPLPVKAIIQEVSFKSLRWKFPGLLPIKSIQVIASKDDESLFMTAKKIEYNGEFYGVAIDGDKNFMIQTRSDYIVVMLGIKNEY